MPALLITFVHFSVWVVTKALASAGVNTIGIMTDPPAEQPAAPGAPGQQPAPAPPP